MTDDLVSVLAEAFSRYEAALAAVAAVPPSGVPDEAHLREVRRTRIVLCGVLERSGWEIPNEVRSQLLHDRTQLARGAAPVAA